MQHVSGIDPVVEVLTGERVAGHVLDQAHPVRRVASHFSGAFADAVDRRVFRQVELAQRRGLGGSKQQRQRGGDLPAGLVAVAIEFEQTWPALREPARRCPEEPVTDRGAGDAAVGEFVAMLPEVGAQVKASQHALDNGQHGGVVRIRAQEAQGFVQAQHFGRCAQPGTSQRTEQGKLGHGAALATAILGALQCDQGRGRHRFSAWDSVHCDCRTEARERWLSVDGNAQPRWRSALAAAVAKSTTFSRGRFLP
ncbi:MAG: hypothetical protein IPI73_17405 [Betaproteobacteria bacterium]|nr:hypothetical protein [Betaproteobacteria bacterium]